MFKTSSKTLKSCIECPKGWQVFKGNCIKIKHSLNPISWNQARSECSNEEADLFDIKIDHYFQHVELFSIISNQTIEFYVNRFF